MSVRASSSRRRVRAVFVLCAIALLAVLLNNGAPLHTHASPTPGIFNEDHDLSALATLGAGSGLLPQMPSVVAFVAAAPLADAPRAVALGDDTHRSDGPRAPPAR